jgi:hypothetical protein
VPCSKKRRPKNYLGKFRLPLASLVMLRSTWCEQVLTTILHSFSSESLVFKSCSECRFISRSRLSGTTNSSNSEKFNRNLPGIYPEIYQKIQKNFPASEPLRRFFRGNESGYATRQAENLLIFSGFFFLIFGHLSRGFWRPVLGWSGSGGRQTGS